MGIFFEENGLASFFYLGSRCYIQRVFKDGKKIGATFDRDRACVLTKEDVEFLMRYKIV